ncbi:MAG TPA: hypothetical protein VGA77_01295, partial [Propylenella sp.]
MGQETLSRVLIGRPSLAAINMMANTVGYSVEEVPWDVREEEVDAVRDYQPGGKPGKRRSRHTILLRRPARPAA